MPPTHLVYASNSYARITAPLAHLYHRASIEIEDNVICNLEQTYFVEITLDYDADFYKVLYNGIAGYVLKKDTKTLKGTFATVDITSQKLTLYSSNKIVLTCNVVTGKPATPSSEGLFTIDKMECDTYLEGYDDITGKYYRSHVNYWIRYHDGQGLHDADGWRSSYGGEIYLKNGSHGCVNMPLRAVEIAYQELNIGDKVLVYTRNE